MLLKYFFLFVTIHYAYCGHTNINGHHVRLALPSTSERSKRSVELDTTTESQAEATYLLNCLRSDEHLNKCVLDITNEILPSILEGISQFKIPSFQPYDFGTIIQPLAANLDFIYQGKALPSKKDAKCYTTNLDLKHKMFQAGLQFKTLELYGNFTLNGTLNNKPIYETGCANFSYINPKFFYTGHWTTEMPMAGDGKHFMHKIATSTLSIVKYDGYRDRFYHVNTDRAENDTQSNELGLNNMEPAINSALCKIGNDVFTLISDIFCSLIPDPDLLN